VKDNNKRLLDIACGPGFDTKSWSDLGFQCVGIDIDKNLIKQAIITNKNNNADLLSSRSEALPFKNDSFDICVMSSLLEHVNNWHGSLKECHRVLRKQGVLFVSTTNRLCPYQGEVDKVPLYSWMPNILKKKILAWIIKNRPDLIKYAKYPAINWFTHFKLKKVLKKMGFEVFDTIDLAKKEDFERLSFIVRPVYYFKDNFFIRTMIYFALGNVSLFCRKIK
jgi:2-polyprenyl-6-hydroxyphenyl methylase/3-demethylubiquinone-9 3-methyltransferase